MTVNMPVLENIQKLYHNDITRHEKGKQSVKRVKDIAGKTIRRVLANAGKTFWRLLDAGLVIKIALHSWKI